jgi:hypothetical protein
MRDLISFSETFFAAACIRRFFAALETAARAIAATIAGANGAGISTPYFFFSAAARFCSTAGRLLPLLIFTVPLGGFAGLDAGLRAGTLAAKRPVTFSTEVGAFLRLTTFPLRVFALLILTVPRAGTSGIRAGSFAEGTVFFAVLELATRVAFALPAGPRPGAPRETLPI